MLSKTPNRQVVVLLIFLSISPPNSHRNAAAPQAALVPHSLALSASSRPAHRHRYAALPLTAAAPNTPIALWSLVGAQKKKRESIEHWWNGEDGLQETEGKPELQATASSCHSLINSHHHRGHTHRRDLARPPQPRGLSPPLVRDCLR